MGLLAVGGSRGRLGVNLASKWQTRREPPADAQAVEIE